MKELKVKFMSENVKHRLEVSVKDRIISKLETEIKDVKGEILIAKRILKDSNLSYIATRKFKQTIDTVNEHKVLLEGAEITDLIEK